MSETFYAPMTEQRLNEYLAFRRIVLKAWSDSSFKAELLANPNSVLAQEGFPIADGVSYFVAEDKAGQQTLVLPPKPDDLDVEGVDSGAYDPGF